LVFHISGVEGLGEFQQTIRQGTFAMVDMGYNAEIPYVLHIFYLFQTFCYQKFSFLLFKNQMFLKAQSAFYKTIFCKDIENLC